MEVVKQRLGFNNMEVSEAEGWKGGTVILWIEHSGWEVFHHSKGITGIKILNTIGETWMLWACYCLAEKTQRSDFWKTLTVLIKKQIKVLGVYRGSQWGNCL